MLISSSILEARALFDADTKIGQNAIRFLNGIRNKTTARAFLGLSKNNKMPCYTLSLSERASCPRGGELAKIPGTICHNCYAAKGADAWKPAINAKARRYALMQLAAKSYDLRQVVRAAFYIALSGEEYFRFHSSGDLFSDNYAEMISEIIAENQNTLFWIPTREAKRARILEKHVNCAVRVSDDLVNQKENKYKGLTSGAHTGNNGRGQICHAMDNGGSCGDCRACWNKDIKHVSYKLH